MAKVVMLGNQEVTVVSPEEKDAYLTESDREMDRRAVEAVKAAIHRAEICKKPIAKYDEDAKRAYLLYPDGRKKYAE